MDTDLPKYPPLTQAALVNYIHLNPFSEVVPAKAMAEIELRLKLAEAALKLAELSLSNSMLAMQRLGAEP